MRRRTFISGVIGLILFLTGAFMKYLHLGGAGIIMAIGLFIFLFGFLIMYSIDKVTIESRIKGRMALLFLFLVLSFLFVFGFLQIFHLPGALVVGYLNVVLLMCFMIFFSPYLEGRQLKLRKDRQLASILFTDIVGYTALMGEDELNALKVLEANRKIQKRLIRKHRGKWLKEMGDGTIAVFYTASEAVLCALEIQREIQNKTSIKLRMGIHISEIVFTDKDIFGDGVNVASRISSLAGKDEICISDAVYQNIRNREELTVQSLGEKELKNVKYTLKIYKIAAN